MNNFSKSVTPREFETLVANLQRKFSKNAEVKQNTLIKGSLTGKKREVDVAIYSEIGGERILIAVECKRRSRKSDVNQVEAFNSKLEDIRANKGVIVSAKGFSKTARILAEKKGISLYRYEDTLSEGWPSGLETSVLIKVWELQPKGIYIKRLDGSKTDIHTDIDHKYFDIKTGIDTPLATILRQLWDSMPQGEKKNGDHCIECATSSPDDPAVTDLGIAFQSFRHQALRFGKLQFEGLVDDESCVAKTGNWKMVFPHTELAEAARSPSRGSALTLQICTTHVRTDDPKSEALHGFLLNGHLEISVGVGGVQELPFTMH